MEYTPFKEAQIAYTAKGKGPALVLLHGFLETQEIWNSFSKFFSDRFKVICPDLPGHGKSESFGYVHTMEEMAGAVHAVLKKQRIRKCVIVGHSMGGYVALAFAELFPDMVRGLCIFHSSAEQDSKQKKEDRDRTIELVKNKKAKLINELIPGLFAESNRERLSAAIEKLKSSAKELEPRGIIAALAGMRDRPSREMLVKFAPFPILYIIGKKDPVFDWEVLQRQAQLNSNAQTLLLDEAGHMGFLEAPEEVLPVLRSFVSRASGRRRNPVPVLVKRKNYRSRE